MIKQNEKFRYMLPYLNVEEPTFDSAIQLFKLIIWMEREKNKPQLDLFDIPDEKSFAEFSSKSEIKNVSELFLCKKYNLPYYYSEDVIFDLSSGNVQQFLNISGKLFTRIMSNVRVKRPHNLFPEDQDEIIRTVAKDFWNEIPRYVPRGDDVQRFLKIVATFCKQQTFRNTAPYTPGVTGFALSVADYKSLLIENKNKSSVYERLSEILRICIAYNLVEAGRECLTTRKGKEWLVLYLNRIICVHFDLPLGYGGFREQPRKTLFEWVEGVPTNLNQQEMPF